MSRYTLLVRADRHLVWFRYIYDKDLVEAVLAKLPSHYEAVWEKVDTGGWTMHSKEPFPGAVLVQVPVGRLATLVPYVKVEGEVPAWYVCSGEFNDEQLAALKAAMVGTQSIKDVTWKGADGELGKEALVASIGVV